MTWADHIARGYFEPTNSRMRFDLPHGQYSFASFTWPGWVGRTVEVAPSRLRIYWRDTRESYAQYEYYDEQSDFWA